MALIRNDLALALALDNPTSTALIYTLYNDAYH